MKTPQLFTLSKTSIAAAGAILLLGSATHSQAQLLWYANFDAVSNGSPVPTNGSTTPNAVTIAGSLTTSPSGVVQTLEINSGSPIMATEPAIGSTLNNTSANIYANSNWSDIQMRTLSPFASGSTMVVSFDVSRESNPLPWSIRAVDSSGAQRGFVWTPSTPASTGVYRYTWINNNSGSSITTPIGTLTTGNTAFYRFNGTTYVSDGINFGSGINMTGFRIITNGALSANTSYSTYFDNFGVWANATDTYNSVNVLNLTPGTVVPEPSSILLLLMAVPLAFRHFRRHKRALKTVSC